MRARLKITWSPLSIVVGSAGSTRSCCAATMPAACSAAATVSPNVCTVRSVPSAVTVIVLSMARALAPPPARAMSTAITVPRTAIRDGAALTARRRPALLGRATGGSAAAASSRAATSTKGLVSGSGATTRIGPVRIGSSSPSTSRSAGTAGMGAVTGPASGIATRPVSRADRPTGVEPVSCAPDALSKGRGAGDGAETPWPLFGRGVGLAVGTGEQADGAAEPVPGEAGRGFGEGVGRAAGAGASGASVAAQNPEFGVRGAAGAGSGSAQSAFPACDPTGVVGVNSSPTIRGIGPVISMVLMTGIRDVELGQIRLGRDHRQLAGRGVGRGVFRAHPATGVGDDTLRERHHRLEGGAGRRPGEVDGVVAARSAVPVDVRVGPRRLALHRAEAGTGGTAARTRRYVDHSHPDPRRTGQGNESRSRRPGGR